jgi:hypothetical protein
LIAAAKRFNRLFQRVCAHCELLDHRRRCVPLGPFIDESTG